MFTKNVTDYKKKVLNEACLLRKCIVNFSTKSGGKGKLVINKKFGEKSYGTHEYLHILNFN